MSLTRSAMRRKTPATSFFTMVELIAVISITAILLTITIRIMKTDSTKANAQAIGSSLGYAQSYALSELTTVDSDSDGYPDEYVIIEVDSSAAKLTITKRSTISPATVIATLDEKFFIGGSTVDADYNIGFRPNGDPISATSISTAPTTLATQQIITVVDNRNSATTQIIKVKPFTGKITYY